MIYLIPNVPDRLTRKHRESGWQHVPLDRTARKELRDRVEPLRSFAGITAVLGSDLDSAAVHIVARLSSRESASTTDRGAFPPERLPGVI